MSKAGNPGGKKVQMEQNICCKEKLDLTNATVNTLIVNCCCKCGCNEGGDNPQPPEEPEKKYKIMTVKVDLSNSNPATCCSYADDAVGMEPGAAAWDEFFGHYPVMFKDGKEVGKLNPNDFTKFVDGTAADITSGDAGDVMICFPRRGLKIETVGDIMTVSMTDDPDSPEFEYLAHVRGDQRRDVFYLGAYKGFKDTDSKLRSLSGKMPTGSQTIGTFRTQAQANGTGYEQSGFYQATLRQAMYLLKYRHLNSQQVVGMGYVNGTAPITTGGTESKGLDWGENTGKQHMKLLGLEDAIGNIHEFIDGIVTDEQRVILTATDKFNDIGKSYINQGSLVNVNLLAQYMKRPIGTTTVGFITSENGADERTHFCDHGLLVNSSISIAFGCFGDGSMVGVFSILVGYPLSTVFSSVGARLMYL